jgi:hypothetical protein
MSDGGWEAENGVCYRGHDGVGRGQLAEAACLTGLRYAAVFGYKDPEQ